MKKVCLVFTIFLGMFFYQLSETRSAQDEKGFIPKMYLGTFLDAEDHIDLVAIDEKFSDYRKENFDRIIKLNDFPRKVEAPVFPKRDLKIAVHFFPEYRYGKGGAFIYRDSEIAAYKSLERLIGQYNKANGAYNFSLGIVDEGDASESVDVWLSHGDIILNVIYSQEFNDSTATFGVTMSPALGFVPVARYRTHNPQVNFFSVLKKNPDKSIIDKYVCEFKPNSFSLDNIKDCFDIINVNLKGDE